MIVTPENKKVPIGDFEHNKYARKTPPRVFRVAIPGCIPARDAFMCLPSRNKCFNGRHGSMSLYGGLVPLGYTHSMSLGLVLFFLIIAYFMYQCNGVFGNKQKCIDKNGGFCEDK